MDNKITKKLFVAIQPLQYLQALELLCTEDENILIVLWANKDSQLHKLVDKKDWSKIIWFDYKGTYIDIIKNRKNIKCMLNELGVFDELIVSAYYNEFINLIVNWYVKSKVTLLEDGLANLLIDTSKHYQGYRFKIKFVLCKLFGFNVSPMNTVTVFTIYPINSNEIPSIASDVITNKFSKLRSELSNYSCDNAIYFISSAYINARMMSKNDYILFLQRLALENTLVPFNIILHRFDKISDFKALEEMENVNVVESTGPVELYFKQQEVRPRKIITSGSGATETLRLIYGVEVEVVMPPLNYFHPNYREQMTLLLRHFNESYSVKFI